MFEPLGNARAALALVLVVGLVVPVTTGAADGTCKKAPIEAKDARILTSTPLSGEFSATEVVYRVDAQREEQTPFRNRLQGIDGYVVNIGCEQKGLDFRLTVDGEDPDIPPTDTQMELHFFDSHYNLIDVVREDPDNTGVFEGDVAPRTQFVVVTMPNGPLVSGIDYSDTVPEPYAVQFDLTLH